MNFFPIVELPDRTARIESLPFGKRVYPKPAKCKMCGEYGSVNPRLVKQWDRICAECRDRLVRDE